MDRKKARFITCPECGHRIKSFKTAGSWVICYKCGKAVKLAGFNCDYNVRCRVCNKGYSPDTKGSVRARICSKCKAQGRGKVVKHGQVMEVFYDELEEIV